MGVLRYLPEFLGEHRLLVPQTEASTYKLAHPKGRGMEYQHSPDMDKKKRDKTRSVAMDEIVKGVLVDGWLQVELLEEKPKRQRDDDDDDDDEDADKALNSLSTLEYIQGMQQLLVQKLDKDTDVVKTLIASFDRLAQEVVHGDAIDLAESASIAKLLGHATEKKCWMCQAVVPRMAADGMDVLKLRSELIDAIRKGRAEPSKPGLLKHLLVSNQERVKLMAPQSKL